MFRTDADGTAHEDFQVLIFADGEHLGEFSYDPGSYPSLRYRREGTAFFCPFCGEIWGRLVYINSRGQAQAFTVAEVACRQHPDQWSVAGSMLVGELATLLPFFPLRAAQREFEVHLKEL